VFVIFTELYDKNSNSRTVKSALSMKNTLSYIVTYANIANGTLKPEKNDKKTHKEQLSDMKF
jgi:hypothetical protein